MTIKIGNNGMGRIGRMVVRTIFENEFKDIKIKHINNRSSSEVSSNLLKYDSVHGQFKEKITFNKNSLTIGKHKISFSQETNIDDINWSKHGVDYVLECTGKFNSKDKLYTHLKNGAKKVIVSAPCKNADKTVVFGVNEKSITNKDQIISAASCTTNCLAPVLDVLNRNYSVERGFMTTIHAFTNDQVLTDVYHSDLRRARSATQSMIPTKTGAASAVGLVLPDLEGKLDGFAIRVPTINVSIVDLCFNTLKKTSIDKINNSLLEASQTNLKGILGYTSEPLVSTDFNHTSYSSVYDESLTREMDGDFIKICAWYDNEWGFSNRMLDVSRILKQNA